MTDKDLKEQLARLKKEKGIYSRQVGQAKKEHDDPAPFILKVQDIVKQIKAIEAQLKEYEFTKLQSSTVSSPVILPPQFSPHQQDTPYDLNLTVKKHEDSSSWDHYVKNHPNATIYHSWATKLVIESSFGHNTYYLSVKDEKQQILGVLPLIELNSKIFGHFLVSVPFYNYGGILYSSQDARQKLLAAAIQQAKVINAEHIELRDSKKFDDLPFKEAKVSMLLNLPQTKDKLWANIGTKLRAQIKKSERNDLQTKIGKHSLLNDFYRVFSRNMRDLGTPVYSKSLFSNMLSHHETAHIVIIYHHGKPVSCGFILGWKNTMEIPWASTIRNANRLDANMKLYWEILKFTIEQGYEIFDFGRSSKEANTYRFKKQWGAKPYPLYWHYWLPNNQPLPEINPNNPKFKIMISVWKKLPLWIANIIGPKIVKSLP